MSISRLFTSWESVALVLVATLVIYVVVIVYTRVAGPRSLATMSSFDFAATVAIGSTVATVANLSTPLVHGVLTLAVLYSAQVVAAVLRRRSSIGQALDNSPLLLMADGELITGNLRKSHIAEAELWSNLRQHGVTDPGDVLVVLETTGDISVLTGDVDGRLLADVRGTEALRAV